MSQLHRNYVPDDYRTLYPLSWCYCWYCYADDATAGGTLVQLCEWWDKVVSLGPHYGYFANPMKTWLTVKQEHHNAAKELFRGTGVNITTDGRKHL